MTFKLRSMLFIVTVLMGALTGCDTGQDIVMNTMLPADATTDANAIRDTTMSDVTAVPVKLVWLIDYPLGGKEEYLEWVASVAPTLSAPEEVKRLASYDNYHGKNPHRLVEFEFDSIQAANDYQEREELHAVSIELPDRTSRVRQLVFELRSDYVAK